MDYYFAYGSNMNHKHMMRMCGDGKLRFLGKAYLEGYCFVYSRCFERSDITYANIVESENGVVWGGLYEIGEGCLERLDYYEGYPTLYDRKKVKVVLVDENGSEREYMAWVYYLVNPQGEGIPLEEYERMIIQGAKDCGLPEDYINKNLIKRMLKG